MQHMATTRSLRREKLTNGKFNLRRSIIFIKWRVCTVPRCLYKYIRPDNLSGCLRLTAQKAYQPERMSKCKISKPAKMSSFLCESGHFLGFRYFTSGHSLGLVSFLCCQSQTTREIVRPNIFIKATRDGGRGLRTE